MSAAKQTKQVEGLPFLIICVRSCYKDNSDCHDMAFFAALKPILNENQPPCILFNFTQTAT
jgi:hypothetical protein